MQSNASHIFGNVYCFPAEVSEIIFDRPIKKIKNISERSINIQFDGGYAFALANDDIAEFPSHYGYPIKLGVDEEAGVFIQVQEYGNKENANYFRDRGEA